MPKEPWREFADTSAYPYFSVATTSTHDMGGIRVWWEENPERASRFYHTVLQQSGDAPTHADQRICDMMVRLNLHSSAMLCILPLQDWLATDGKLRRDNAEEEQINFPANPQNYWHYRMHLPIEQLLAADTFNSYIHKSIAEAGRI